MSFRISKSFGGVRFSSNFGSRERRPTQAELAAESKEQFLNSLENIYANSSFEFWQKIGYTQKGIVYIIDYTQNNTISFTDIIEEGNIDCANALFDLRKKLREQIDKVNFSGVLSSKKRETLTDIVFAIYDCISNSKPQEETENRVLKLIAEKTGRAFEDVIKSKNKVKFTYQELTLGQKIKYFIFFSFSALWFCAGINSALKMMKEPDKNITSIDFIIFFILSALPLFITYKFYKKAKKRS
ncbi:hypothetical protein [Campylobacter sp.]|uniref:hypothetical protein n=1 Tax=Campylobacter sp. TaxID=205 RepID=UPI0029066B9C|nr:hypothetical protein [Campylobacter sp.]MDU6827783.1 hypothetical protein [Campylobacter sp.]